MSARAVSLRALVLADLATIARAASRPAAAELLRRGDSAAIAIAADDLALAHASCAAAASAAALAIAEGREEDAICHLADDCGLPVAGWIEATCAEQGVEIAPTPAEVAA